VEKNWLHCEFWILLFFFEGGEKVAETEQEVKCRAWRQPESEHQSNMLEVILQEWTIIKGLYLS